LAFVCYDILLLLVGLLDGLVFVCFVRCSLVVGFSLLEYCLVLCVSFVYVLVCFLCWLFSCVVLLCGFMFVRFLIVLVIIL